MGVSVIGFIAGTALPLAFPDPNSVFGKITGSTLRRLRQSLPASMVKPFMNLPGTSEDRRSQVEAILRDCGSVLVACSGGVDSVLLAAVAARILGEHAVVATAVSASLASGELDDARAACLSSRIPYGSPVTPEKLTRIDRAESALKALGFHQCRVRDHGDVARIEIETALLSSLLEKRAEITAAIKQVGFPYVALDLDGFRSGSMNEVILKVEGQET